MTDPRPADPAPPQAPPARRPRAVLAMHRDLTGRLFDTDTLARLSELAELDPALVLDDFGTEEARAALAGAEVIVSSWGCPAIDGTVLDAAPGCAPSSTRRDPSSTTSPTPAGSADCGSPPPPGPTPCPSPSTPSPPSCSPTSSCCGSARTTGAAAAPRTTGSAATPTRATTGAPSASSAPPGSAAGSSNCCAPTTSTCCSTTRTWTRPRPPGSARAWSGWTNSAPPPTR